MKVLCDRCGTLAEARLEARPAGGAALRCGACGAETALPVSDGPPAGEALTPSPAGSGNAGSADAEGGEDTAAPVRPSPSGTGPADPGRAPEGEGPAAEDAAWAEVLSRWDEDEAHRAFLVRFADLEGLAAAGWRYRRVLAERPGDAVAMRWREEILRRATAQGLAQLPRLGPPRPSPRLYRWAVVAGAIAATVLAAGWMAWRLFSMTRG